MFKLLFTTQASQDFDHLTNAPSLLKRFKAVRKALGYLESNPRHPGLNTHKFSSLQGPSGEEVFEAYAENNTPAAYRIFWYYGPDKKQITIIAITPHPSDIPHLGVFLISQGKSVTSSAVYMPINEQRRNTFNEE